MAEDKKQPATTDERAAPDTSGSTPAPEQIEQATIPGMADGLTPAGKVINLSDVRTGSEKQATGTEKAGPPVPETRIPSPAQDAIPVDKKAPWERPFADIEAEKPKKAQGRSPKTKAATKAAPADKSKRAAPDKTAPPKAEKVANPEKAKAAPVKDAAPKTGPEAPPVPRDATRSEEEKTVYINISELHPFKEHPFGVRDDAEMKALVESVSKSGVNQPALVRPREGGGYEIIAGHRRQRASELAGYFNMPCIVRNMTDDEAILAMTDDNLRHREKLLPSEKAAAILQQYEAIKHQGARGDDETAGKLSLENVGQRNGMSVKTVQRYAPLVRRMGGQVIELAPDSPNHLNPMDIQLNMADGESPLSMKADFLLSLCELIVGGKEGLQPIEKTVIDRCVRLVYRETALGLPTTKTLLLQDLYEELLKQPEPEARRVATALELYCTGSLNLFNHPTNVKTSSRVVCIVLKGMGENLRKIAMHITNQFVTTETDANFQNGVATWCYFDEFHVLLRDPLTASYFVAVWKMLRKKGCVPSALTQNVKDLLASREIENILDNTDFMILLSQAQSDRAILAKQIGISEHQLSYITHSNSGEGLLFYGSVTIPFVDRFPQDTEIYRLLTTKPEDLANDRKAD